MYEKGNTAERQEQGQNAPNPGKEELDSAHAIQEPTSSPEPQDESEDSEFDYSSFNEEFDSGALTDEEAEAPTAEETPEETEPSSEVPPREEEGEETPPSGETQEKPKEGEEEKEKETEVDKEESEEDEEIDLSTPPQTQEEWQQRVQQAREKAQEELQQQFSLTEEQADEFLSDPQKALPKMSASLYLSLYERVIGDVKAMVPQMVRNVNQVQEATRKNESEFTNMFPSLENHMDEVHETANIIIQNARSKGRKLTKSQLYRQVGVAVSLNNQIPLPQNLVGPADGAFEQQGNTEQQSSIPAQDETPAPHRPTNTVPSSPSGVPQMGGPRNTFEVLAMEEDDWGD